MFEIGEVVAIHFLEKPEHILLGRYKYQHKFLYISKGSGTVKLENNLFKFSQGSFYAFRVANSVEIISAGQLEGVVIVFNTVPFADHSGRTGLAAQLNIVDRILNLVPISSQIHEHQVQSDEDQESVSALLQIIRREMQLQLEHSHEIILNNALNVVNIAVRIRPRAANRVLAIEQTSEVSKVVDYVQDKLRENKKLTIAEIARGLTIREYVLNRLFIKSVGITFADYLKKTKSELAAED